MQCASDGEQRAVRQGWTAGRSGSGGVAHGPQPSPPPACLPGQPPFALSAGAGDGTVDIWVTLQLGDSQFLNC